MPGQNKLLRLAVAEDDLEHADAVSGAGCDVLAFLHLDACDLDEVDMLLVVVLAEAHRDEVTLDAGLKLVGALDHFTAISLSGKKALDIGASTGGFTEVMLAHGAAHVIALDVGRGQLHDSLSSDSRVTVLDGMNARHLTQSDIPFAPEIITCDASFISLAKLLPAVLDLAAPDAVLIALIKPQFEVGKGLVGKGGIVRDATLHDRVVADVRNWLCHEIGWRLIGVTNSPIDGPDGNREFLIAAQKPS